MWISKSSWDDVVRGGSEYATENRILREKYSSLQSTLDWLMLRVTQLEKERAVLLERVCGVVIEIPVISRQPISPIPQNVPVDALPIFDDMGEDMAKKLGVDWNPDGTVKYA